MRIDLRTGTPGDVRDVLVAANDMPYPLDAVIDEKLSRRGYAGELSILTAFEGIRAVGAAVVCGGSLRLLGVVREFRNRGIGTRLFEEAANLAAKSHDRLAIFGEAGNYFVPGVPENVPDLLRFFERRGCERVDAALNLAVDLARIEPQEDERVVRADATCRADVVAFIEREFGRIWAFEVSHAFENEPVTLFFARDDKGIVGFSAHEANNARLGTFGPAGVAKLHRGGGVGRALLLASLVDLRRLGYAEATIPWVSSVEFYAKSCGARLAHRFIRLRRDIAVNRGT